MSSDGTGMILKVQIFNVYTIETTLVAAVILSETSIYYSGINQISTSNTNNGGHVVSFNLDEMSLDADLEYDGFLSSTLSSDAFISEELTTVNI